MPSPLAGPALLIATQHFQYERQDAPASPFPSAQQVDALGDMLPLFV
jgi:hypothetical protein